MTRKRRRRRRQEGGGKKYEEGERGRVEPEEGEEEGANTKCCKCIIVIKGKCRTWHRTAGATGTRRRTARGCASARGCATTSWGAARARCIVVASAFEAPIDWSRVEVILVTDLHVKWIATSHEVRVRGNIEASDGVTSLCG